MEIPDERAGRRARRRGHQQHARREAEPKRGIPVFNAPGANANAVKELVLAGLFLAARNICQAWGYVARARRRRPRDRGGGREGQEEVRRLRAARPHARRRRASARSASRSRMPRSACGMKVLGYDPQITVQRAWQLSSGVEQALSLDDLFARCDMVTVHVPLNDATRSARQRGADPADAQGRRGAQLRARRHRRRGGRAARARPRPARRLRLRLPDAGVEGSSAGRRAAAPRRVDRRGRGELRDHGRRDAARLPRERQRRATPSISPRRCCRASAAHRVAIANENVPNMVGQISTCLAEAGLNIADLLNKSRGDLAYTLIDTEAPIEPDSARQAARDSRHPVRADGLSVARAKAPKRRSRKAAKPQAAAQGRCPSSRRSSRSASASTSSMPTCTR